MTERIGVVGVDMTNDPRVIPVLLILYFKKSSSDVNCNLHTACISKCLNNYIASTERSTFYVYTIW